MGHLKWLDFLTIKEKPLKRRRCSPATRLSAVGNNGSNPPWAGVLANGRLLPE